MRASVDQFRDVTIDAIQAGADRLSDDIGRLGDLAPVVTIEVPKGRSRHRLRYAIILTIVAVVAALVVRQRAAAAPAAGRAGDPAT